MQGPCLLGEPLGWISRAFCAEANACSPRLPSPGHQEPAGLEGGRPSLLSVFLY